MKTLLLALTLFSTALLPAASFAQAGGRTCQYDLECGATDFCNDRGRCVTRGSLEQSTEKSANDQCGEDRRCRIDRLKRKNNAQRHATMLEEERYVRSVIEDEERERLDEFPRLKDPLSGDIRISRLGALGLHAGYVLFGHLQPELEFAYSNLSVYVPPDAEFGAQTSGNHRGWFFRGGLSYFLLESWFSPYISAGFQYGTGAFSSYDFFDGGLGSSTKTEFHAAEIGGGADIQFSFGLHSRLGLAYRPLVYNQARIGPGQYDPLTREGLARWYKQAARIDVIWLLGWAI